MASLGKIEIENINMPGRTWRVDRAKYEAMRAALLAVLPLEAPKIKVAAAKAALLPYQPEALLPIGKTAGQWLKAIQLDLDAKGVIQLAPESPVHLFRPSRLLAFSISVEHMATQSLTVFETFGQDHPLHRQADRHTREGVDLSVSTLAD